MGKIKLSKINSFRISKIIIIGLILFSFVSLQIFQAQASKIDEKREELRRIQDKIDDYQLVIDAKQKDIKSLESQIEAMDARAAQMKLYIQKTQAEIDQVNLEISEINRQILQKEIEIRYQKKILIECVRTVYEQRQTNTLFIVASSDNFSDFLSKINYVESVSDKVKEVMDKIDQLRAELAVQKDELVAKQNQLKDLKTQKENEKKALDAQIAEKNRLLKETQGEEAKYKAVLNKILEQQRKIFIELIKLESQAGGGNRHTAPKDGRYYGYLIWPENPHYITQGYGMTPFAKSGVYGGKGHNGIDICAYYGAPIRAAAAGNVIAGTHKLWGNWVAVQHPNGLTTLYAHMKGFAVTGGYVKKGQVIGYQGNTGFSTGSHLHFSVYTDFWTYTSSYGFGPAYNYEYTLNPLTLLP